MASAKSSEIDDAWVDSRFPYLHAPWDLLPTPLPKAPSLDDVHKAYAEFEASPTMLKVRGTIAAFGSPLEGHLKTHTWMAMQLATEAIRPRRVLEIGFNAGHSAHAIVTGLREAWGTKSRDWSYTTIDINCHKYTDPCFQILRHSLGPFGK